MLVLCPSPRPYSTTAIHSVFKVDLDGDTFNVIRLSLSEGHRPVYVHNSQNPVSKYVHRTVTWTLRKHTAYYRKVHFSDMMFLVVLIGLYHFQWNFVGGLRLLEVWFLVE